ncbi:hypothetical protein GCM10009847_07590 [Leucobacter tardus]
MLGKMMLMTSIPAGWYPNPENDLEVRYWDGLQWTTHVQNAVAEKSDAPSSRPRKRRTGRGNTQKRRAPIWVVATTGAAALLLGVGIGAGSDADAANRSTISDLEQQLTLSQEENTTAATALDDAVKSHDEQAAALTEERDDLSDEIETLTKSVEDLTAKVAEAEAKTSSEKQRADAAEAQAAAAVPSTESEPATSPTPTYFQNCSAARAAGAAPVYAGDPGYGPHLDRDGDGVGCE